MFFDPSFPSSSAGLGFSSDVCLFVNLSRKPFTKTRMKTSHITNQHKQLKLHVPVVSTTSSCSGNPHYGMSHIYSPVTEATFEPFPRIRNWNHTHVGLKTRPLHRSLKAARSMSKWLLMIMVPRRPKLHRLTLRQSRGQELAPTCCRVSACDSSEATTPEQNRPPAC